MNIDRESIIRMAREAGLHLPYWDEDADPKKDPPRWTMVSPLPPLLERFAALVAAAAAKEYEERLRFTQERWEIECQSQVEIEREACAKVCDGLQDVPATEPRHCAQDIRARSNT